MDDLKYPVGKFIPPQSVTTEDRRAWIAEISQTPAKLRAAVQGLSEEQLDTPYRPGGWTVRQVVHHVPDSHMNSYIRFKLALTEERPVIKPYDEAEWAKLPDAISPPGPSLELLDALHSRWVTLLEALSAADFARVFMHPELGPRRLDETLALYDWHGRHHVGHITALRKRMGW
jgi:uncharacterized damage-inducible protein DinB